MTGFSYKGNDTNHIISHTVDNVTTYEKLVLGTFSQLSEMVGHNRDNVVGEATITRPVPNEYGTLYQNPSFSYCLIKENNEPFTDAEQIIVERWLTSPKFSSPLVIFDCYTENEIITYDGKFINTEWVVSDDGYAGVTFTFQSASPYPYKSYVKQYEVRGTSTITLNCESDELEEYTYPVVEFYAPSSTNNVTITNVTDGGNSLTIKARDRLRTIMDCDHCILRDATSGVVDFDDVGWDDVDNIYWLRLLAGNNSLSVSGNVDLKISYKAVVKRAGGWL